MCLLLVILINIYMSKEAKIILFYSSQLGVCCHVNQNKNWNISTKLRDASEGIRAQWQFPARGT